MKEPWLQEYSGLKGLARVDAHHGTGQSREVQERGAGQAHRNIVSLPAHLKQNFLNVYAKPVTEEAYGSVQEVDQEQSDWVWSGQGGGT